MLKNLGRYRVNAMADGTTAIVKKSNKESKRAGITVGRSERMKEVASGCSASASSSGGSGTPGGSRGGMGATAISSNYLQSVLESFGISDDYSKYALFKDMYYNDIVCGATIDLWAQIPFSEFNLSLPREANNDMMGKFAQSLENLRIRSFFPELTVDFLALGASISAMHFDKNEKIFSSMTPFPVEDCEINPMPSFGVDPIVDVIKLPESIAYTIANQKDERVKKQFDMLPPEFRDTKKTSGRLGINPENLLYINRKTRASNPMPYSFLTRAAPLFLLEKALLRGTIETAYRRQRAITHAQAGDMDWIPTDAELKEIADMVIMADLDPTGAVIATRDNISFSEFRDVGGLWKYEDSADTLSTIKMRALCTSEAFLSGEANFNAYDSAMSVTIEQMKAFREMLMRKVIYGKVFAYVAVANDFKRIKEGKPLSKEESAFIEEVSTIYYDSGDYHSNVYGDMSAGTEKADMSGANLRDYYMPTMAWRKALMPEGDQQYLEMLGTLAKDYNIPVPLRMIAAAGGITLTDLMDSMKEDVQTRTRIMREWTNALPKNPNDGEFAALQDKVINLETAFDKLKPVGLLNRDFSSFEVRDPETKKVLSKSGKDYKDHKSNKVAAAVLSSIAERTNKKALIEEKNNRKKTYSYAKANPY